MKKIFLIVMIFIGFAACKKSAEAKPDAENYTQYPIPGWSADQSGKYPVSMTAVVNLPTKLKAIQAEGDKLAAFVGEECRGEGILVQTDSTKVFFVMINGTASEQSKISFRFYSKKTSHLYETPPLLSFRVDDNYGTADRPKTLELTPIK